MNKLLEALFSAATSSTSRTSSSSSAQKKKRVMYQCRHCGYKSVRSATEGAPLPGTNNCSMHPRGMCKGPHSWMRTYL